MKDRSLMDSIYKTFIRGQRKKVTILILSFICGIIVVSVINKGVTITYNSNTDNVIGVNTIEFDVPNLPYGKEHHIVGYLYASNDSVTESLNYLDPKEPTAPGIIFLHGYGMGLGKEMSANWCIELARRGFIVLSIDLPYQGLSTGDAPHFMPSTDFEPYVIDEAINTLKALPFVNSSSIGVVGYSLGGSAAGISAGILWSKINATVMLNGMMDFTDCLLNYYLSEMGFSFSYTNEIITLETLNGRNLEVSDLEEFLRLNTLWKGDSDMLEKSFISGTTALNRTELQKNNAVNYLHNATPDSLLFIHGKSDDTFGNTNQSGQGYNASTNGAIYLSVDTDHNIRHNDTNWAMINFLKQKLMNVEPTDLGNEFNTYTQETDQLGFPTDEFFNGREFNVFMIAFIFGMFIVGIIINIIYTSKKYETGRSKKEEGLEGVQKMLDFGGFTFKKQILGLLGMYGFSFALMTMIGDGVDTLVILWASTVVFYIGFYFTMIYTPDNSEITMMGIQLDNSRNKNNILIITKFSEVFKEFIIVIAIVSVFSIIIGFIIPKNLSFGFPIDTVVIILALAGFILIASAYIYLRYRIGINTNQLGWNSVGLDRYSLIKSLTFGSAIGLNFIMFFNAIAHNLRFPLLFSIMTPYFYIVLGSAISISVGLHLWTEVILKKRIMINFNGFKFGKTINCWILILVGMIISFLCGWLITLNILDFGNIGNMSMIIGIFFAGGYLLARLLEFISAEKGILGYTIAFSLICVTIFGYFFKY